MQPLLNIAVNAARAAGNVIMQNLEQLEKIKISTKENNEFFSEVDIKAEQIIIHTIHKAYPSHGIIAEESGIHNNKAESVWVIDPLDGTTNYLHGFPYFCVSIAHVVKNKIEHAVIYDPLRHECFTASRGGGARLNDYRIRVSKQTQLSSALMGTGFSMRTKLMQERFLPIFASFSSQCAGVRRSGSAALDLAYLANGRLDGLWQFGLRYWDIAAGVLIVKEAGGLITDYNGDENFLSTGDLVAANPRLLKAMLQVIHEV